MSDLVGNPELVGFVSQMLSYEAISIKFLICVFDKKRIYFSEDVHLKLDSTGHFMLLSTSHI